MSELTEPLLAALAEHPAGVSLPRLCKRLRVRMSVLLRELAWIGDDAIGGEPGPGWVRVETQGESRLAVLTERGRERLRQGGIAG
ncbi:hypothetical protein LVB77_07410 [Lysobacter sp. 5GHs7-4]|uniref:hypothetical protein n=1 Tax=Lysobacter sp. 5GHs7-4 TaxID=2904253 RepID=UPI001E2C1D92|nr:hypothetical protein [Lysobacter sp. 5GHs7-4]UHQ24506.1 hypothetical protein LVB77_07410 [Lysobacter sp. 5GHs7-4]